MRLEMKSFLGFLTFVATALVVFVLITSRTEVLWGVRSFNVLTGSMEPNIAAGSVIFVKKALDYTSGDIIAFNNNAGKVVAHRIIQSTSDGFKTQGDANNSVDGQIVNQGSVIGKEIFAIPFLGKLSVILKTIPGFVALILVPVLGYIVLEILNIKKEIERRVEEKFFANLSSTSTQINFKEI